jgi:hypothetical protein
LRPNTPASAARRRAPNGNIRSELLVPLAGKVRGAGAGRARLGRRSPEAGFTLVDTLIGAAVLVIAILAHASSVISSHRLNTTAEDHALAMETTTRFVERLRADPDWKGLYTRLRTRSWENPGDTGLARLSVDTSLPTFAPTSYYADFTAPRSLGTVTVLVQVPATLLPTGVKGLREDAVAPRYGLPGDLNGDGAIDSDARDADYRALPVVVRVRWRRAGQAAQEVVLATWLRGER